jgi:hypothetical protein
VRGLAPEPLHPLTVFDALALMDLINAIGIAWLWYTVGKFRERSRQRRIRREMKFVLRTLVEEQGRRRAMPALRVEELRRDAYTQGYLDGAAGGPQRFAGRAPS